MNDERPSAVISTSATPRTGRGEKTRRGSVLVFTVLLLVLLAGIGTSFVMFVNLEYAASGNALRNTQSRATAETGLEHACLAIRESVRTYRFESPDGPFKLASTLRPYLDETAGLFRFFEYHPGLDTVAAATGALMADRIPGNKWETWRDFAWLYWNKDSAHCGVAGQDGQASGTPHDDKEMVHCVFTESPLAHGAYPNAEIRKDRGNGIEHAGLARRFVVYNPVTDFFAADPSKTVSPYRGEYYVWVTDLDGKLFAPYSGMTWGMTNATDVQEILGRLATYGYSSGWGFDASGSFRMNLSAVEIAALAARPSGYSAIEDVALHLGRMPPASGSGNAVWDHLFYRYGLERYFTCWADHEHAVKVHETGLNVNTASFEVLAAALSRIPLVDGATVGDNANFVKASYLAKRICAKRPFVCRIDFEDFLAAHLNANPAGPADDPTADVTPLTPVRMIYLAIPKRNYVDAKAPLVTLKLADLMEAPVSDSDPRYAWLRNAAEQRSRFLWFRDLPSHADPAAPISDAGGNAFLSIKAFNNILNSISGQRPDGSYGYSFYSADGVLAPFEVDLSGTPTKPKFEYKELEDPDLASGGRTYVVDDPAADPGPGELIAWRLSNSSGHYETVFSNIDDAQVVEYLGTRTTTVPDEKVIFIQGNGTGEVPHGGDDQTDGVDIFEQPPAPATVTCESTIHGPLRAYRFDYPAHPEPVVADAAADVSWSPRFCFRSRFFKVYVLARSIATLKGNGEPVYGPTSRLEAVYDAVDDKILWRRWQATELRRLSDPVP